jgi:hypothetical protein
MTLTVRNGVRYTVSWEVIKGGHTRQKGHEDLSVKILDRLALPCEGGVEYLHRNPASRRRRRKGKSRIWDSTLWSRVPRESDPKMSALERARSNCKRQTRPLVRQGASHQQTSNYLTVIKIWSWAPDECFIPRQTGRQTVGRNMTLTLTKGRPVPGWYKYRDLVLQVGGFSILRQ